LFDTRSFVLREKEEEEMEEEEGNVNKRNFSELIPLSGSSSQSRFCFVLLSHTKSDGFWS
jgi:hypothetical protein